MKKLTDLQKIRLALIAQKQKDEADVHLALYWDAMKEGEYGRAQRHKGDFTSALKDAAEWCELATELTSTKRETHENPK